MHLFAATFRETNVGFISCIALDVMLMICELDSFSTSENLVLIELYTAP
jgi:hypothetical protein